MQAIAHVNRGFNLPWPHANRPRINGLIAQLILDSQQLIIFRHSLTPAQRTRLDLTRPRRHGQICNRRVFGLTRAVADHTVELIALG